MDGRPDPGGRRDPGARLAALAGSRALLAVAVDPAEPGEPAGCLRRRQFRSGRRLLGWVQDRLGIPGDPTTLTLPHPRLSLSHSGPVTVAVGIRSAARAFGVGVDVELRRPIDPRCARFFLDPDELGRLAGWTGAARDGEPAAGQLVLQRLWTVKEAVFKADPGNAGRQLRDYRVTALRPASSPDRDGGATCVVGRAHRADDRFTFRSIVTDDLVLTIAWRERTRP
jgi:hypothetical protein